MTNIAQNTFSYPFKDIIIDEVALQGLEGIGLDFLWKRIEKRVSSPVTEKLQCRFWNLIVKCECLSVYENPEPVPCLKVIDRFEIIDETSGHIKEPDDFVDGPYEYHPIEDENGCEGSCVHYTSRVLLDKEVLSQMAYKEVLSKYKNSLVVVASKEERWAALAPHLPITYAAQLTKLHYCILELIGKSRENGQMTIGDTNLAKLVKDSKLLFYNRKVLQQLDLIRVSHVTQVTPGKGAIKAILLRLKRFHRSLVCSAPKTGWIHNLMEYLKEKPDFCESTEAILKKGLVVQKQIRRLQKKLYIFGFEENPIRINEIKKREKGSKRRYIYVSSITDDEASESEDEEQKVPLKCQYKVGVQLLRQAYERFLEAGLTGLTQIELGQLLGTEFYISRTICRMFKTKNIVREFLEDKGRQRTARFIAVAATAQMDIQYAEEKEKFMKYVDECANLIDERNQANNSLSDSEYAVPRKKMKIETQDNSEYEDNIIEIHNILGVNPNNPNLLTDPKKLTLRQLKFASGALKILRDRQIVKGYQALGKLISEEIKEPPMDTKALKTCLQRLLNDGCIKVYGLKWPQYDDKYTILICAPQIKKSHPYIKTRYNSILVNSKRNTEKAKNKLSTARPLTRYSFPRYMKLQKLHESLVKYAYLDDVELSNCFGQGFVHIKDFILELTLEVALGIMTSGGISSLPTDNINDDLLSCKVHDLPADLRRALTTSSLDSSIRNNLKMLAIFGLIQPVAQVDPTNLSIPDNCLAINLFYVNKNATILDTSGVWPKKNVCFQNIEKKFNFKTAEDIKDFWQTVYDISTNTKVEVPNRRGKKPPQVPIRAYDEVDQYDKGLRFGDNLGPCGYDSIYFLELIRLWKCYCSRTTNYLVISRMKKKTIKIPKFEKPKKKIQRIRRKTISKHKTKLMEKMPQVRKPLQKKALLSQPLIRKKLVDQVKWTIEDDKIIMLCIAALQIMSPISQPGSLQIRNLVMKDILSIKDSKKTIKQCHRRAGIVNYNSTMTHLRDCVMTDLKNHTSILQKYDGMLKKLRMLNCSTNITKFLLASRVPMMELVWVLIKVLNSCSSKQTVPVFASLEDFNNHFTAVPSSANKLGNTYKSAPNEIALGPLKEAIMLTLMLSYENTVSKENAKKIYQNFKRYDETILRDAVVELRLCRAMVAKEKVLNGLIYKVNLDDIVDCWFKISSHYQRKWLVRLNSEFGDSLGDHFDMPVNHDDLKASPQLICFCSELQAIGVLDVIATVSPIITGFTGSIIQEDQLNSIDIESKYKLKAGTYSWRIANDTKSFADIYEPIQLEEPLQKILWESVMRCDMKTESAVEYQLDEIETKIVAHLKTKEAHGSTFHVIKEISGMDTETLTKTLTKLISQKVLKRVGVYENLFVVYEYAKHWCMEINNYLILSKPWLTIDAEIRKDVFLKWAAVVLNKVFEFPGSTVTYLSDSCEYLSTSSVQDICEVLCKWKCVTLNTMVREVGDLFSEDDDVIPELVDYNMYESPQNIYVFPVADSLVRFSYIRKCILNSLTKS